MQHFICFNNKFLAIRSISGYILDLKTFDRLSIFLISLLANHFIYTLQFIHSYHHQQFQLLFFYYNPLSFATSSSLFFLLWLTFHYIVIFIFAWLMFYLTTLCVRLLKWKQLKEIGKSWNRKYPCFFFTTDTNAVTSRF